MFRGLANVFYDRAAFGIVYKSELAILKRFNVGYFPSLIAYQTHVDYVQVDEISTNFYQGVLSAAAVGGFIELYSLPEKKYITNKRKDFKVSAIKQLDRDNIENWIEKMRTRRVVILFTEDGVISEEITNFANMMK
jgi:hypothetical protein